MCGRTCLSVAINRLYFLLKINYNVYCRTLNPEEIIRACRYKSKAEKKECGSNKDEETILTPAWRAEYNCGRSFVPSYNIAPTDICPVIVSDLHFCDAGEEASNEHVIMPMMWGMIPFWHRGDYRKHGLTTNNCRMENMLESKMYRRAFDQGQRCVILCEGFYEWQTTKAAKPSERHPYFIYATQQQEGIRIFDKETWAPDDINLIKLAGLFDIWENDDGNKIYSYSVITFEASQLTSWLHHRMPAILDTDQQIDDWLDFKRVQKKEALSLLQPATKIKWHRVASTVNNSRNKTADCNKPLELVKSVPKNKIMAAWLNKRKSWEDDITKAEEDLPKGISGSEKAAKRPCSGGIKKYFK